MPRRRAAHTAMAHRPLIGLTPLYDTKKASYWMLPDYMDAVERAGGAPLMLPLTDSHPTLEALLDRLDGIIFTGGPDVDPAHYGAAPTPELGELVPARDTMELWLLDRALASERPLLGICRGLQILNVKLGGTLIQDLPTTHGDAVEHDMEAPYDRGCHRVDLVPGTSLYRQMGASLMVNSRHHQAIDRLAPDLLATAYSEDGLIEAVVHRDLPRVRAVQWHPEMMVKTHPEMLPLFARLVKDASAYRKDHPFVAEAGA